MISLRLLSGEHEEMVALQRVLEGAPQYAERAARRGVYAGGEMIGCADVIRGWPRADTTHIGLLVLAERHQRRGHGRAVYQAIEKQIRAWGAKGVRIGVVRTNEDVLPFWEKLGFSPTGEVKPYRYGPVVSEVLILEKGI